MYNHLASSWDIIQILSTITNIAKNLLLYEALSGKPMIISMEKTFHSFVKKKRPKLLRWLSKDQFNSFTNQRDNIVVVHLFWRCLAKNVCVEVYRLFFWQLSNLLEEDHTVFQNFSLKTLNLQYIQNTAFVKALHISLSHRDCYVDPNYICWWLTFRFLFLQKC